MEHEFYKELPELRTAIFDELKAAGFYHHRPDKVRERYTVLAVAVGGIAIWALVSLAQARGYSPVLAVLAGVSTGLPVLLFGAFMPARTVRGTRRLEEVLGFQEFMDRVESDRFQRMIKGPEQFEAYLPYAMALGVDAKWVRAFRDLYTREPEWYRGTSSDGFRMDHFSSSLDSMAARTESAMGSAPRGSSGSGFSSGGGFSGGGGGGGGGGGF